MCMYCVTAVILSDSTLPVFLDFLFRKQELQRIHSKLNFYRFQRDTQSPAKPRPASKNVQEVKARHCLKQWLPATWLCVSGREFIFGVSPGIHRSWVCPKEPIGVPQLNASSIVWEQSTSVGPCALLQMTYTLEYMLKIFHTHTISSICLTSRTMVYTMDRE